MEVDPEELLSSAEVAQMLRVKASTLMAWRSDGRGPKFLKIGRLAYYRRSDIRAYLGSLLREPKPTAA